MLAHFPEARRVAELFILSLPQARRPRLQHQLRRHLLRRYLWRRFGSRFSPVDGGPPAPPELVSQTSVLREEDVAKAATPDAYFAGGYLGVLMYLETIEQFGFDLRSARAVLDFGCGAAKNTRLLRGIEGLRVVGTDVSAAQIAWARKHVPGVELHVNEREPPLRFAKPDEFDLVTAASVFTHVPLDIQRPWLEEIHRILAPDGYFLCTVAGSYHIGVQLSLELRQRLREEGGVTLGPDDPGVSYATRAAGSCDVFQTREEVQRVFESVFEVLDYSDKASGQDHLVLRKRQGRPE
jgi:SAM-dependent methyltransferase